MAESRVGRLLAAVLEQHGSKNKLKALIRDHGKREALAFVDVFGPTRLNLLQMSVVMGNSDAGMHYPCGLMLVLICLLLGRQCLTCSNVHGAADYLISLGADVDVWWDKDTPDNMAAPPPRDMPPAHGPPRASDAALQQVLPPLQASQSSRHMGRC